MRGKKIRRILAAASSEGSANPLFYLATLLGGFTLLTLLYFSFPPQSELRFSDQRFDSFAPEAAGIFGIAVVFGLLSGLAWLSVRPSWPFEQRQLYPLSLLLVTWTVSIVLTLLRREELSLSVLAVPAIIILIMLKPPSAFTSITLFSRWLGVLSIATWISLALHVLGLVDGSAHTLQGPNGSAIPVPRRFDIIPLDRWDGPFPGLTSAGYFGVLMTLHGIRSTRWERPYFFISGFGLMALAESRTAAFALLAGLAVAAVSSQTLARSVKYLLMLFLLATASVSLIYSNGGNGRLRIWREHFLVFLSHPTTGFGLDARSLQGFDDHAHNFFLDIAAKFGMLALGPLVLWAVIVSSRLVRKFSRHEPAIVAMWFATLVFMMLEQFWQLRYPDLTMVALLFFNFMAIASGSSSPLQKP